MTERRRTPEIARYEEIALAIATKVSKGEFREGERVSGRSTLAGTFQVSPETIRRAIAILHERGVVRAVAGSGVVVLSRDLATQYLETVQARLLLRQMHEELEDLLGQRQRLDERIADLIAQVMQWANRTVGPSHIPDEVSVPPGSWLVGQTLASAGIRTRTGATVIALIRSGEEHFSPGPEMVLREGDVLLSVGPEEARDRLRRTVAATDRPG